MLALLPSVLFPCNKTAYLQGRNYLYKVYRYVCIIIIKDYCLHHTSSSIVHGRTSILRIGWRERETGGEECPAYFRPSADSADVVFDPAIILTIAMAIEENTHLQH